MKKLVTLVLVALLVASFASCGNKSGAEPEKETPEVVEEAIEPTNPAEEPKDTTTEDGKTPIMPKEPIVVADAAMYRGELIAISEDGKILTLQRDPHDSNPSDTLEIQLDDQTTYNVEAPIDNFYLGGFFEVYYPAMVVEEADGEVEPSKGIAVNYVAQSMADVITNGEVISVNVEEGGVKKGSILVKDIATGEEKQFNFAEDGSTQFYMNFEEIKEGETLHIYHKMASTRSLPPQYFALEISPANV